MKKGSKTVIAYWVIAGAVICFLCGFLWMRKQKEAPTESYPVVMLGDSIFALCRDESSIPSQLEDRLQIPVFNGAFGGSCMALNDSEIASNYTMELLNMVSLSKAIASKDFGVQKTVRSRREITDYFADTIQTLSKVDFSQAEVLILSYGINDYHAGIPVDNPQNPYDENSYGGAMRSVIESLQKQYPNLRIVVVTPTYAWYRSTKLTCEEPNAGGYILEDYVNKELEIVDDYGIEAVDCYHDFYPHAEWTDWKIYSMDGLHPNLDGRTKITDAILELLQTK